MGEALDNAPGGGNEQQSLSSPGGTKGSAGATTPLRIVPERGKLAGEPVDVESVATGVERAVEESCDIFNTDKGRGERFNGGQQIGKAISGVGSALAQTFLRERLTGR